MATGFSVHLQKLIDNATYVNAASEKLYQLQVLADGPARDAAAALGILGTAAMFPERYNRACDLARDRATEAVAALDEGVRQLLESEAHYAAMDPSYARSFGIIDDGTRPAVPNLGQSKSAKLPAK